MEQKENINVIPEQPPQGAEPVPPSMNNETNSLPQEVVPPAGYAGGPPYQGNVPSAGYAGAPPYQGNVPPAGYVGAPPYQGNIPPAGYTAASPQMGYVPQPPVGTPGMPPGSIYGGGHVPQSPPFTTVATVNRQPFTATKADGFFALACFVLGYIFIRWAFPFSGFSTTGFTLAYAAAVLLYARAKKISPAKQSWFWLAIMLCTGVAYGLFPAGSMAMWQGMLLFGSAVYWCGSLFGGLAAKKTSNYIIKDALNLLFVVPFKNFGTAFLSLKTFFKKQNKSKTEGKQKRTIALSVLLGVLICVPVVGIVFPLLTEADSGNFTSLFGDVGRFFRAFLTESLWENIWIFAFATPVALYICGLVAGNAHRRYTTIDTKQTEKNLLAVRNLPSITTGVVLAVVSGLYIIFISCQIPYFFSAFSGARPAGYEVYSAYARDGFFELCCIAAINLCLLLGANLFCKTPRKEARWLRIFNLVFSVLTLLLITTAFSKMVLYITAYGLTPARVMACVFLLFLAGVYGGVILLQYRQFSIVRFAVVLGSAMLCLLCLSNMNGWIIRYNADQYIAGSLSDFDEDLLYNGGGLMAVQAAQDVAKATKDDDLRRKVERAIQDYARGAGWTEGTSRDNYSYWRIRQMDLIKKSE